MRPLLSLLAFVVTSASAAQPRVAGEGWEFVYVGTADVVDLQVFADGRVLAATKGGPQVSWDGGESWGRWLTTAPVTAVAFAPGQALFIGQDSYSARDSAEVGSVQAWRARSTIPGLSTLSSMAFAGKSGPGAQTTAIVADSSGRAWAAVGPGVLHYPGIGRRWSFAELPVTSVLDLYRGPTGKLWAATTNGVFSAESDGYVEAGAWVHDGPLKGITFTSVTESHDGQVWAGTAGGSIYRRLVGEPTWARIDLAPSAVLSLVSTGVGDTTVAVTSGTAAVIAGTALDGAFRSSDGGATWHATGVAGSVVALAARDSTDEVWAAVQGDGLRRSLDGGQTWSPIRWSNTAIKYIEAAPSRAGGALVAGDHGPYGMFAYSRATNSWRPSGLGRSSEHPYRSILAVTASPDGRFYALVRDVTIAEAGIETERSEIRHARDVSAYDHTRAAALKGSLRLSTLLYRSEDGGASWRPIHAFRPRAPYPYGLPTLLAAGPDGTLMVGTTRSGKLEDPEARVALLHSSDAGETWTDAELLDVYKVNAIALGPGGAAYAGVGYEAPNIYRSLDGGANWAELGPVATGDTTYQQIKSLAVSADGSVVAGLDRGAYRSTDRGQT